jgi:hypothetical protein
VIENPESFWVKDAGGQTVGWFYFRADPLVAKMAGVLTKDEARRMAVNFAKLPEPAANPTWTPCKPPNIVRPVWIREGRPNVNGLRRR